MIKKHFKRYLLILFFFLITTNIVPAEDKKTFVKVGVFQLAPMVFIDGDGSPQGVFVDIINKIAEKEGWKIEYIKGTWNDGFESAKNGHIDLMTAVMHLSEREPFLDFPKKSTFNIWGQIYVHNDANISGVFDLEGKKIGVLKGGANGENFINLLAKIGIHGKFVAFDSQGEVAQAIKDKRVDAGVFTNIHGYNFQQSHQLKQTQIVFDPSYLKYATAKGTNQQLLSTIDSYLSKWEIDRNSPYHKIIEKHLGLSEIHQIPGWVWIMVIICSCILVLTLFVSCFLAHFNKKLKSTVKNQTQELNTELDMRKKVEKKLIRNEERLSMIVNSMSNYVWEVDTEGRYEYCSEKVQNILGYSPDEMIGKTLFKFMIPDDSKKINKLFEQIVDSKSTITDLENWYMTKEGQPICLLTNGFPIFDQHGLLIGYRGIHKDITEKKKNQKEKIALESKLQQAQKMETIGTLAGGIAHDFNNILFPIVGYAEMLLTDTPEDSPSRSSLKEIYTAALRAKDLVKQILTFSRQGSNELMLMKMQPLIKEALKLIRSTIPTTIEIKQDIHPDCGVINADPTQIHQIVMNLSTNAYHAMEETGGELKVSLKQVELGEYDIIIPDMTPGIYACLTVADTGKGMDKNVIDKIFDPFFTTKEKGKGTGMGLSVVHGIVTKMNGAIQVYSEPGEGTQFHVYLPVEKNFSEEQVTHSKIEIQCGTEQILLVDDEEAILSMEKRMLERLGYQVTSRTSSPEALEAFRANPDKFDLVITDMAMPNMPGDRLSVELTKIRPDIPILLCTGFSETMSEERTASLGIKGFLWKPIIMKDLAQKIREVLDKN